MAQDSFAVLNKENLVAAVVKGIRRQWNYPHIRVEDDGDSTVYVTHLDRPSEQILIGISMPAEDK